MVPLARRPIPYADYLALERDADERHEYLDGQVWAMGGGTPRHSRIETNLVVDLANALGDGRCQVYDNDLRVRVLATGLATYPDLTVVCGALERHPEDPDAVTNPTVVLEVLSPSTEGWDRGGKFLHLGQCPALQHYVLAAQDAPLIEVYTRAGPDSWELRRYGPGQRAPLPAAGVELDVDAAYRNLPPDPA
jgi:Uma2 family endonuclease